MHLRGVTVGHGSDGVRAASGQAEGRTGSPQLPITALGAGRWSLSCPHGHPCSLQARRRLKQASVGLEDAELCAFLPARVHMYKRAQTGSRVGEGM